MIEIRYITRYCRLSGFCDTVDACLNARCDDVLLLNSSLAHLYGLKCMKSNINRITTQFRKPRQAFQFNYGIYFFFATGLIDVVDLCTGIF